MRGSYCEQLEKVVFKASDNLSINIWTTKFLDCVFAVVAEAINLTLILFDSWSYNFRKLIRFYIRNWLFWLAGQIIMGDLKDISVDQK